MKATTIMLLLFICCAAVFTAKCDGIIDATLLVTFAKQYRAPQPLELFYDAPKEKKLKLKKLMSKEGFTLDLICEIKHTEKFLLVVIENDEHLG
jgi:hypothetical protein